MRALVFDGHEPKLDPKRAEPQPAPGEALIRPVLAGVCATDLEICRGYMEFRGVLGHEFVGVVEQVVAAPGVNAERYVGKRVVGSINCVCGRCDMCIGGKSNHCRKRTVLGIQRRDGCFADRFVLPVRNLLLVPDALDDDHAVFTEPLAAACQILRQVRIEPNTYVTVLGDGRLGLLVGQVLVQSDMMVRVVGKHAEKMALCEKWGLRHRHLSEISPRADQEIIVDCTGSPAGLELAFRMVRPCGKIILKTTVAERRSVDWSVAVVNEIQLIGSRCGPFNEAIEWMLSGRVDVLSLISQRMHIDDGVAILKNARHPETLKVLVSFG